MSKISRWYIFDYIVDNIHATGSKGHDDNSTKPLRLPRPIPGALSWWRCGGGDDAPQWGTLAHHTLSPERPDDFKIHAMIMQSHRDNK